MEIEEKEKIYKSNNSFNISSSRILPSYAEIHNKNNYNNNYIDDDNDILPSYNEVHRNNNISKNEYNDINEFIQIIEYKKENNNIFKEKECLLCLKEYENGVKLCILECQHTYHELCFKIWFIKKKDIFCPLCQADIE